MSGSSKYLLDTNIVLYLLNGDKVLAGILDKKSPFISFITEMELLSFKKIAPNYEIRVKSFLYDCTVIEMNPKIKELAIKIRRIYGLKLPDSIVAATSEFLKIPMLTGDDDFNKLKSLNILQYKK